ncbi:MAG: tetratricopeptide repeat protein [Symploca sp. SIO2E6]|nr:tetratricopeptide repeat protein [Symploca sp. SIO2E6]
MEGNCVGSRSRSTQPTDSTKFIVGNDYKVESVDSDTTKNVGWVEATRPNMEGNCVGSRSRSTQPTDSTKFIVGNDYKVESVDSRVRPEAERDLLETVKQKVEIRLGNQLHHQVKLNLTQETQPQQVRPWNMEAKLAIAKPSQLLPPDTTIGEVFDQCSGSLLILGEPGAGKTTSLLDLALELVAKAEANPRQRIPVVVDLSDWQPTQKPGFFGKKTDTSSLSSPETSIPNWLKSKVRDTYGFPLQQIQQWLEEKRLVPLLDGLDEVSPEYQQKCVQAINLWLKSELQPRQIAVCCRREPYESYSEKLQLEGAVYLQDLTDEQIQRFLVEVNRSELAEDLLADKNLLALIRRPLLLSMAIIAYKELKLIEWQQATSTGDKLNFLLDAYIRQMLTQDTPSRAYRNHKRPSYKQSRKWLEILALELLQNSETDFLVKGSINTRWLSTSLQKRLFTVLAIAVWGIVFDIGFWALGFLIVSSGSYFVNMLGFVLSITLISWVESEWQNIYINRLLLRLCLLGTKSITWNYTRFLNYATERLLLQRTGSSYRFLHDLLRQYLAQSRIDRDSHRISPQVFFRCGESYASMEQYDNALQQFNRAIELEPKYVEALRERAKIYKEMKRYEEALQDLKRTIELEPTNYLVFGERAKLYKEMKRDEDALQDLKRALELEPTNYWTLIERAEIYKQMKRYEEALQDINRVIERNPKDYWTLIERAEIYKKMERYEEALPDIKRALELEPKDYWVLTDLVELYKEMERYEDALQDLKYALELNPKNYRALIERAKLYKEMKCYAEALQDLKHALELEPKYSWAYRDRAKLYKEMERYEDALQDLKHALELEPKYSWAYRDRAELYKEMKCYEEALQDLKHALELEPKYSWVIRELVELYKEIERYEDALLYLNRAFEREPKNYWVLIERAELYKEMERYEDALQDFSHAFELNPKFDWAIAQRGKIYILMEHYEQALQDFNRAIELNPKDYYLYLRSLTYLILQKTDSAKADLNNAIKIAQNQHSQKPDDCRNTFNLALYYLVSGNLSTAQDLYQATLQHGAPQFQIRYAIQDLKDMLRVLPDETRFQEIRNRGLSISAYLYRYKR